MKNLVCWILFSFLLCGCKPSECFVSTGSVQKVKKEIDFFHTVRVEDNVSVILTEGNDIYLEAGENLIPNIEFSLQKDSTLTIRNKNSCNWLRSYDVPVKVYLGVENLQNILWKSYGNLTSHQKITKSYFLMTILDANAIIDLDIDAIGLYVFCNSGADMRFRGEVQEFSVFVMNYCKVDASKLIAQTVKIKHQGQNDLHCFPVERMEVAIESSGNVYYYQEPQNKNIQFVGSGLVLKK